MGSDLDILVGHALGVPISIHAPAWGATPTHHAVTQPVLISIHAPAWGATRFSPLDKRLPTISIHAPAWGATVDIGLIHGRGHISIHAPAWGATLFTNRPNCVLEFQSTLPHGERHEEPAYTLVLKISIHAPAWGATHLVGHLRFLLDISIHAPAWGATISAFNRQALRKNFNPRSRMGSDTLSSADM